MKVCFSIHQVVLVALCSFMAISVLAEIEWKTTSESFKADPLKPSETVEFAFTNIGTNPVTITKIKSGCGCLSGVLERKKYDPGESGIFKVTFDLKKREGAQRKGISIFTDDNPAKPTTLYVSTSIPKTYAPSKIRLIWKSGESRDAKIIKLTNSHQDPFALIKAVPQAKGIEIELKSIRDGYEYALIIKPSPDLKNILVPIVIHPQKPRELDEVKTFTVYALFK